MRFVFQMMPGSNGYLDLQWALERLCGVLEWDWMLGLVLKCLAGVFFWNAVSAARFNTWAQLEAHLGVALAASAAVLYKHLTGPRCTASSLWGYQ